jgi:hypothetical protein
MPWPFDDKPAPPVPLNAMQFFRDGGRPPAQGNAMSAALLGKQTAPIANDFSPRLPPLPPQGEIRNAMARPRDYMSPVAEALSPTLGGYGMGQLAGDTVMRASEGDYSGAGADAAMLAMGLFPGFRGKRPAPAVAAAVEAPKPTGRLRLVPSQRTPEAGQVAYAIMRDQDHVGDVVAHVKGNTAILDDIYAGDPWELGVSGLRDLRESFRAFHPDVIHFQSMPGERLSGSRNGEAAARNNKTQKVTLYGAAGAGILGFGYGDDPNER